MDEVLKENAQVQGFRLPAAGYTDVADRWYAVRPQRADGGRHATLTSESMNLLVGNYGKTPGDTQSGTRQASAERPGAWKSLRRASGRSVVQRVAQDRRRITAKTGVASVDIDDVMTYAMLPAGGHQAFETRPKGPVMFEAPVAVAPVPAPTAPAKPVPAR